MQVIEVSTESANKGGGCAMTSENLQAIRERANKATAGPWIISHGDDETADEIYIWLRIGEVSRSVAEGLLAINSRFIAHAREDVPTLCDEVERLTTENTYHELQLDRAREEIGRLQKDASEWQQRAEELHELMNENVRKVDRIHDLLRQALAGDSK
jgi:hypothetical protein